MKSITLTVEDELLEQVKLAAAEQRTTINDMVRGFLATVAEKRRAKDGARQALLQLARETAGDIGQTKWNRGSLHDR
ncbi:hypothetical protein EH240_11585 [Mesorhizobium tamadayense]|uniref:Uncharacterized protein n=1 Tax=Mesorhizobium tamadayense TaxID=425306 RepID=A0A3P3FX08_9HYPH|nr:hypothetical protein [Mesorhizobium tamadayense]RRI02633.1 hypothetical protein EH240_11585 [Mesorhizobium tamadayense]